MTDTIKRVPTSAPEATSAQAELVADQSDEILDVVDESNTPISTAVRKQCHTDGLMHRSTHILLFRQRTPIGSAPQVEVLLQRRSTRKKIGAGQWDVSVAEHLSAGEDYAAATVRGVAEELGAAVGLRDIVKVRGPYLSKQEYPDAGVKDYMFTCLFAAAFEGDVAADPGEVDAVEWWEVRRVTKEAKERPELFTRWFLIELSNIDLVEVAKRTVGEM